MSAGVQIPGAAPAASGGRREHGGDADAAEKSLGPHLQALSLQLTDLGKGPAEALQLFGAPSHLRLEQESEKIPSCRFCCFADPGPAHF